MEKTPEEIEAIRRSVEAHNKVTTRTKNLKQSTEDYYNSDTFQQKRDTFKQLKSKGGEKNDHED